jgi:uncharacterized protein (TIGR04255 family)
LRNEGEYTFRSFFNQSSAVEDATGNELNVVLASQPEKGHLPIILDITATKAVRDEPEDWDAIRAVIDSLRELKNRVFENILTGKCLGLFQ